MHFEALITNRSRRCSALAKRLRNGCGESTPLLLYSISRRPCYVLDTSVSRELVSKVKLYTYRLRPLFQKALLSSASNFDLTRVATATVFHHAGSVDKRTSLLCRGQNGPPVCENLYKISRFLTLTLFRHHQQTYTLQAPRLRADQVTYEEYNSDRSKYTFSICSGPSPEVGSTKIYKVPVTNPAGEIDVRVYVPTEDAVARGGLETNDGKLPAHVDYHGGGFVIGNLESDDPWCRQVCQAVGCIVLNVDYRLAPEYPHPVPTLDSWAALRWVFKAAGGLGIDTERVSIGGLSAGGNIAAALAIMARDEKGLPKLALQLLTVPAVDARFIPLEGSCDEDVPYKSYIENEFAPCLPLNRLRWFYKLWLGTDIGTLLFPIPPFDAQN